ncbi:MAG: methyltransferase domain-containing protein [Pirellulales bacterium]
MKRLCCLACCCVLLIGIPAASVVAQDKSVKPGINDTFKDPKVDEFLGKFEIESREVFSKREKILAACKVTPGMSVADVGAGTGIYTRLFSDAVGKNGQVFAVDIAKNFLDHIAQDAREKDRKNIQTVLCEPDSTKLPASSVDLVYICDTSHHFEFPQKTLASIYTGLKPEGRLIVIDFSYSKVRALHGR